MWAGADRLLEQAVEQQAAVAGAAAVEAERELVQVVVELVVTDRALMGAQQSALEQARDAVNLGHRHVGGIAGLAQARDHVREAVPADVVIAVPAVGPHFAPAIDVIEPTTPGGRKWIAHWAQIHFCAQTP